MVLTGGGDRKTEVKVLSSVAVVGGIGFALWSTRDVREWGGALGCGSGSWLGATSLFFTGAGSKWRSWS